ncbi:N-acetylmuramoyl-L-alanine amidase family protein [Laceyella putida]|uniref:N-acetylmuramoyl-L-alanine amidase n=1 Tax=Laceyella putida TaxID=110101 RepID=A0ABW2RM57_9BACL
MSKYIIIDPGHGGKDSGAVGFGLLEKDVVLNLAKRMNDLFGEYDDATVSLTRWDDRFLELNERADFANKRDCDLFVSIHNNSASPSANGFESYIHPDATSATVGHQGIVHSYVMKYLSQHNIQDRGKKRANFAVLRETTMPAILLENLFITNERENQLLQDTDFLDGLAKSIVEGIAEALGLRKKDINPKPMYRVTVNGVFVVDTAYSAIIKEKVEKAVLDQADEVIIKKRGT